MDDCYTFDSFVIPVLNNNFDYQNPLSDEVFTAYFNKKTENVL